MEPCQSAYREYSSTETALLKIKADILDALDKKEVMCLEMLDLSATFDTISHELLLKEVEIQVQHYRLSTVMDRKLSDQQDPMCECLHQGQNGNITQKIT